MDTTKDLSWENGMWVTALHDRDGYPISFESLTDDTGDSELPL